MSPDVWKIGIPSVIGLAGWVVVALRNRHDTKKDERDGGRQDTAQAFQMMESINTHAIESMRARSEAEETRRLAMIAKHETDRRTADEKHAAEIANLQGELAKTGELIDHVPEMLALLRRMSERARPALEAHVVLMHVLSPMSAKAAHVAMPSEYPDLTTDPSSAFGRIYWRYGFFTIGSSLFWQAYAMITMAIEDGRIREGVPKVFADCLGAEVLSWIGIDRDRLLQLKPGETSKDPMEIALRDQSWPAIPTADQFEAESSRILATMKGAFERIMRVAGSD